MESKNTNNTRFYGIKSSFFFLFVILSSFSQLGFSQVKSFIYFDNGRFMDGCQEFYPMVVPYPVTVILDVNGKYQISGYKGYCSLQGGCHSCGSDTSDWHDAIRSHLSTISNMGFNVVRLNGLSVKYDLYDTSLTYKELALTKVYVQDSLNPSCFHGPAVSYAIDSSTYERQAKLIEEFVSLVKEHNAQKPDSLLLRITITTGTGALPKQSENYRDLLEYLGNYFNNEPTIFSWQINSEPVYFDDPQFETGHKEDKAGHFGSWYYALKAVSPAHFITFGSTVLDIFNWDAMTFPVDYVNLHTYPNQNYLFTDSTLERSNSNLKWFSEVMDKPWIVGETSIAGKDTVHFNYNELIVTEEQQKEYANSSLVNSKWYGALGYTWWIYKEFGWYNNETSPINSLKENYYGLVKAFNMNEEYKVAAEAFQSFDPGYNCDTCSEPDMGIYYNPYGNTDLAVTGTVTGPNQTGIKNAMVRGVAINPIDTTYDVFETFTDEDGNYNIYRKPDFKIWEVRATYPGMSVEIDPTNILPGDSITIDFQLLPIDPDSLPAPLPTVDSLTIYPGQIITWDSMFIMNYHFVIVDSGAKLIIKDTIYVKPETKFIVKQRGKLELDNGAIIGLCTWQGIEVWGDPSSSDIEDQGQLFVKNDAIIENAEVAIRNYHYTEGFPNMQAGGYVKAQNSDFINNEIAVDFRDYTYDNASLFDNCEFVIDGDSLESTFIAFVKLRNIDGPAFGNCSFENLRENHIGYGIDAVNSRFYVVNNSLFDKLAYGIKAIGSGSTLGSHIRESTFTNNLRGIYISGIDDMEITENTFNVAPAYPGLSIAQNTYGAYLDRCTGYTIEENHFTSYDPGSKGRVGLYIYNSGGDDNMVYLNTFDMLEYATVAYGQNRSVLAPEPQGLCYKCNEFTNNDNDIAVLSKEKEEGIKKSHGSNIAQPDAPAGNRFSWTGPEGTPTDINNEGAHITYYHHVDPYEPLKPEYYTESTVTLKANDQANWNEEQSCPPSGNSGGGGGKNGLKDEIATSGIKADSVQNILDVLVDGGDTEATEQNVETSYPPESYAIYNDLMGKSPYLSKDVVDAAIEKDGVLPNVMIRDVMVANPQSAKEDGLIEKLDERTEPMSDYMLAQILQGRSLVGYMEELYSQKSYYSQKRTSAFNSLVKMYVQDSVLQPASVTDSLIALFSGENKLSAKYRLAMLHFDKGDYASGQNILNDIPYSFELDDSQITAHNYYFDFYQVLVDAVLNGEGLTEDAIADLEIIVLADVGLASTYSRNLLIAVDGMEYIEPVILPDFTKSASAEAEYNELMKTLEEHHYLKLFPNPAKDYVIIGYELEMAYDNARLMVYDNKGVLQRTLQAENIKDQVVVDTKQLPTGIYIVSLFVNGKEMESVKFTIVK